VSANEVLLVSAASEERESLAAMLRDACWTVRPAQSCTEALGHLAKGSSPIVICEQSLPDGGWKDLLDKAPKIIVTSRAADEALWAEVLNLGGYDVLAQPFDETEVRRVVASAARN
jgi:DNA-binding NtrC family response regulator